MVEQEDIVECLWAMFDLIRTSDWNHLIAFARSKRATKQRLEEEIRIYNASRYPGGYDDYSCFRITCAGKVYLNNVCTHYEFFSCRALGDSYLPLFCKENLQIVNGQYLFEGIIDAVYQQASACCIALHDSYESPDGLCRDARAPYNYKSESIYQFHSERIIFSHIGYLDAFRCYVLSKYGSSPDKAIDIEVISKRILATIRSYCELITDSIAKCAATKSFNEILKNLKEVEKAPTNPTLTINRRRG